MQFAFSDDNLILNGLPSLRILSLIKKKEQKRMEKESKKAPSAL
jgi:aryl carrier-like protein